MSQYEEITTYKERVKRMNKIQIRKARIKLKAERMAILRKIDELQSEMDTVQDKKRRKELREEIRKLGKELERKVLCSISDHQFTQSSEEYRDYANGKIQAWSMTVEKYLMYKKRGWTDKEIQEKECVSKMTLYKWKKKNGITREMWKEAN